MCSLSEERGTDLAQKRILFVISMYRCVCIRIGAVMFVCAPRNPPWMLAVQRVPPGHHITQSLHFALYSEPPGSSSFLHLALSCLNLLLTRHLSWFADMLIWKLARFYTMKTRWKGEECRAGAEPLWQNIHQICNCSENQMRRFISHS